MQGNLRTLVEQLGWPGKTAFILLAAAEIFLKAGVAPMEARNQQLESLIDRAAGQARASDPNLIRTASPSAKLVAFYRFFERDEAATDWLAKLYALAQKTGVEIRVADYQLVRSSGKLDRYEISMPLTGDYAQIRAFVENALAQIPVLSLDQLSFRRKRANDTAVETDVRFSLHLLRR